MWPLPYVIEYNEIMTNTIINVVYKCLVCVEACVCEREHDSVCDIGAVVNVWLQNNIIKIIVVIFSLRKLWYW